MTCSQHFFMIAMRIDARTMQIFGDIEFHLFVDTRGVYIDFFQYGTQTVGSSYGDLQCPLRVEEPR
jgi:hypothetical protein